MQGEISLYEAIGGADTLDQVIPIMYKYIEKHPDLIPIFPGDFEESARKQYLFLTQFLGGPSLYTEERGHPMLRKRHLPFEITPTRRDAWLSCVKKALDEVEVIETYRTIIFKRLSMTAEHMMNSPES